MLQQVPHPTSIFNLFRNIIVGWIRKKRKVDGMKDEFINMCPPHVEQHIHNKINDVEDVPSGMK